MPVALPPGRLKLATKPASIGSLWLRKTIGIVGLAALAVLEQHGCADELIDDSMPFHPVVLAASSVPSLQWLPLQQIHYHGAESRIIALRGIELF
jgi:hypothetical protein